MTKKRRTIRRRSFLRGAFGVSLALPFLDGLVWEEMGRSWAAEPAMPKFFIAVRSGNGVAQKVGDREPEKFWPFEQGSLTRQMMQRTDGDGDIRSTGLLADYLDKLLIIRGTKYNYSGNGCGHSGGGNQCLTATPPSDYPERNKSLATGESLDNLIQRTLDPDDAEPMTLAAGRTSGYLDEVLSYRPPLDGESNARLRSAERNPWEAYKSIFGAPNGVSDDYLHNQIAGQRKSVNDLLRDQLQDLRRNPALSRADQQRLELHQDAIRDLEKRMVACHLPEMRIGDIQQAGESQAYKDQLNTPEMAYMMNDIIALACSCGLKRAATLQLGNGNDGTKYAISNGGDKYPFHWISHRIQGDGGQDSAPPIQNAAALHYEIDKIHMQIFGDLVGKLDSYVLTDGSTLLDHGVAMWTNDLAKGVSHSYRDLPYIIAGSGGGYLRQGHFIDARDTGNKAGDGWVPHNQIFNTVLNALDVTQDDGSPILDFGHKGGLNHDVPKGGEIPGMKV